MATGMTLPPPPKKPLGFKPLMTKAPALEMWPPMPFRDAYRVGEKPGANWQNVAAGFGLTNVWDLIWFNFRTTDPREVNFYLHRYVGCWQSNDGKNFSFKGADPGMIFIPPFGWKRPLPDPLMTRVLTMLAAGVAHFPYLIYKNFHLSRAHFHTLALAIRADRVQIRYSPALLDYENAEAMYFSLSNKFIFRDPFIDTPHNRGTVVHEATHAVLDMLKASLQVADDELLAFLAEAICMETIGHPFRSSDVSGLAGDLAALVIEAARTRSFVQVDDFDRPFEIAGNVQNPVLRLRETIKHDPAYITEWWRRNHDDGL